MKLSFPILKQWFDKRRIPVSARISSGRRNLVSFRIGADSSPSAGVGTACIHHAEKSRTAISDGSDELLIESFSQEQVLGLCNDALAHYTGWENELYRQMTRDSSLQEILEIGHSMLELPMSICNAKGWDYATAGMEAGSSNIESWQEQISPDQTEQNAGSASFIPFQNRRTYLEKHRGTQPALIYSRSHGCNVLISNLWVEGDVVGAILLYEEGHTISEADLQLLEVFQEMLTRYVSMNKGVLLSRSVLSQYLTDMLERKSLRKYAPARMLHYLGWKVDDTYCVLAVSPRQWADNSMLEALCDDLDRMIFKPQTFLYSNRIICLIHLDSPLSWADVPDCVRSTIPEDQYAWGISHSFSEIGAFADYYAQSCLSLSFAIALRVNGMTMRDIAADQIRKHLSDDRILQSYVHPDVRALMEYDKAHKSAYANTLYQYLFYACNYTDAAAALKLHRNTLIYRINQVQSLITADLNNAEERKLLLLSFMICQEDPEKENRK